MTTPVRLQRAHSLIAQLSEVCMLRTSVERYAGRLPLMCYFDYCPPTPRLLIKVVIQNLDIGNRRCSKVAPLPIHLLQVFKQAFASFSRQSVVLYPSSYATTIPF